MTEEQLREVIRKELTSISKPKEKETANEAAPKMKEDSSVIAVEDVIKILGRVENGMRSFNQSRYSNLKGEFKKAYKALDSLKSGMHRHSAIPENVVNEGPDYDEAMFNLDKIFGDDQESIETFQDIEDNGDWKDMVDYINNWGDEERLSDYGFRSDAHVKKLAKKIMAKEVSSTKIDPDDDKAVISFIDKEGKFGPKGAKASVSAWVAKKYGKLDKKNSAYLAWKKMTEGKLTEAKVNEKSRKWGDIAQLITKAWEESKNIPTAYAKDYAESLERMAKKNAKVFFKMYGDFTQEDFEEDMRYNLANESKVNEDGTDQLAKDLETKVHDATSDGGSVKAQSTKKVWDDGVPVLKYIARAPKKSMKLPKKFRLVDDEKYGWWYFEVNGTWYGISKDDYGTPPFDY
jgi:hypothetical protein